MGTRIALATLLALTAALVIQSPGHCTFITVYSEDFQDPVGSEWSLSTRTSAPNDATRWFLGRFGGPNIPTLTVSGLPEHTRVQVSFDFIYIHSWEATDRWMFYELPSTYLGGGTGINWFNMGGRDDLGYATVADYYQFSMVEPRTFTFDSTDSSVQFNWIALLNGSLSNESWGLDNVRVAVENVPEPGTGALMLAGLGLLVARRRRSRA